MSHKVICSLCYTTVPWEEKNKQTNKNPAACIQFLSEIDWLEYKQSHSSARWKWEEWPSVRLPSVAWLGSFEHAAPLCLIEIDVEPWWTSLGINCNTRTNVNTIIKIK